MQDRKRKILFCVPNRPSGIATKTMLEQLGYSVDMRTDSYEALRAFAENTGQYRLVMLYHLARLAGTDLVRRMRAVSPDVTVVLLNAPTRYSLLKQANPAETTDGDNHFLSAAL